MDEHAPERYGACSTPYSKIPESRMSQLPTHPILAALRSLSVSGVYQQDSPSKLPPTRAVPSPPRTSNELDLLILS